MIKRENTLDIPVFDGDDGIKYIRYNDVLKVLEKIKEKENKTMKLIDKLIAKKYSINCFNDLIVIKNTLGGVYNE